jgi:nucleoside-diphosphate-sugar epimerase
MPDPSSVLVTGASGFIGNNVVRKLLEQGKTVHVLLRREAKLWRLRDIQDRVKIHWADVTDAAAVRTAIEAAAPDVVYHLSAYGAYESQADARQIVSTNITGSYNIFEAALAAKVKLIVNAGSSSEYGYKDQPMRETDQLEPNSPYAVSKAAQTHFCNLLAKNSATGMVTFRFFSVYGPWEEPGRLFPTIIRRARAGLPLEMVSPETARDFVYVDDALDVLLDFKRLESLKGEVFNLGSGTQTTMREVVAAVCDILKSSSEVKWGGMAARRWDTNRWQADISKARDVLKWSPKVNLCDGVTKMAEWMSKVGDNYGQS